MNIFFLHLDPKVNASYYFNKHCIKIILEICQMLYGVHHVQNTDFSEHFMKPYKLTHKNHPMSLWARQSANNYKYVCLVGLELCYEYTRRYGKIHACQCRIEWMATNPPATYDDAPIKYSLASESNPIGCSAVPLCMPDEYQTSDLLKSYRTYYVKGKANLEDGTRKANAYKLEWNIN